MENNIMFNAGPTDNAQTFLLDYNVLLLKRMFGDEPKYRYYMKTLWILRDMSRKLCEVRTTSGFTCDQKDPNYPIYETINKLIGALIRKDCYFDLTGNMELKQITESKINGQ